MSYNSTPQQQQRFCDALCLVGTLHGNVRPYSEIFKTDGSVHRRSEGFKATLPRLGLNPSSEMDSMLITKIDSLVSLMLTHLISWDPPLGFLFLFFMLQLRPQVLSIVFV
ncbi:Glycine--tRNA ligase [Clarias magur]|uniref:Glycine--tRNA ligase n=1 Tax=Clarias magur TaxID=1594786 RepID=A0A8J4U2H0_CLAMG|nr:Glycine--tRNA ligase [Clarias magur]